MKSNEPRRQKLERQSPAHGSTDYFVAEDSLISVFTVARRGIKVAGAPRSQSPKEQTVKGQRCSGDNIVYTLV